MNRRSLSVLVLAAVALAGVQASARQNPSVDDIIAKNMQAKGGLEKMRAVQTLKQTSKMTLPGGIEGTLTMYGKRPNMTRQELTLTAIGMTVINAFDGQTAWSVNPVQGMPTPTVVTGPMGELVKEQSADMFDGPLVDYKTKGYTVALVGTETVGTRKMYHLKLTRKDLRVQHCYIDVETNLESKTTGDTPSGLAEQEMSDYRDVDGLKMPFLVRTMLGGIEQVKIQVEKIEVNAKFDDGVFKMPKGF
jgi:outer membrane lipoprotein-sorting protein